MDFCVVAEYIGENGLWEDVFVKDGQQYYGAVSA